MNELKIVCHSVRMYDWTYSIYCITEWMFLVYFWLSEFFWYVDMVMWGRVVWRKVIWRHMGMLKEVVWLDSLGQWVRTSNITVSCVYSTSVFLSDVMFVLYVCISCWTVCCAFVFNLRCCNFLLLSVLSITATSPKVIRFQIYSSWWSWSWAEWGEIFVAGWPPHLFWSLCFCSSN